MPPFSSLSAERYTLFLLALLEPRLSTGGWVSPRDLARESGCSRSTVYRLIAKAEAAGLPIVRDSEQGGGAGLRKTASGCGASWCWLGARRTLSGSGAVTKKLTIGHAYRRKWQQGMKRPKRFPVRCTACGQRRTISKHPDEYVRPPACNSGCRVRGPDGVRRLAPLRVDWFRIAKEWHAPGACHWCGGYSFPHARGRGWCTHNPRLTTEMLQDRHESGCYA